MENSNTENGSSRSWWLDNTHNHHHQSQWLQSTLSDLEKKVKKMLSLMEADGDSFAERAEMVYRKRPMLIESVEDLHGSYRCLAQKYNQLTNDDFGKGWNELRSSDDVELLKRSDENRETIDDLCAHIRKLLVENIELKSKLARTKAAIQRNRSQLSSGKDVI